MGPMSGQVRLSFHQLTFDLLEQEPLLDLGALALLDQCEAAYGFPCPASVREWYSLAGAVEILQKYSNDDHPLTLVELQELAKDRNCFRGFRDYLGLNVLPFIEENQSVALWAIHLDGSDDPPVLVIDDDEEWKPCSDHFSTFITRWVWGYLYSRQVNWLYGCLLSARDEALSAIDLAYLREMFKEVTRNPQSVIYHFRHSEGAHIRVWAFDEEKSYWWLRADSKESLLEMTKHVWKCGTLASSLECRYLYGCAGKVLDLLRLGYERPEPDWKRRSKS